VSQARSDTSTPPKLTRDGAARVGLLGSLAGTLSRTGVAQYSRRVAGASAQGWYEASELRRLVPLFALAVALVAVGTEPSSSSGDLVLVGLPVVAFGLWAYLPGVPLPALALAVIVPVAAAQRSGELEPLLFELSVLAFVVARWSQSRTTAIALGLLTVAAPVAVAVAQDPAQIGVANWIMGTIFPWVVGRAFARHGQVAAELEATRRELAEQALLAERRRIARDVHDFVGHGLAAVMLQVTSARHVLHRDLAAAEDALRSAEEVGRRSMQELRRTLTLLRRDDERGVAPPLPTAAEIPELVDQARAGGLAVEFRTEGDLNRIPPGVGLAVYRIAQEALANAARHAPRARTVLGLELTNGRVAIVAETTGPVSASSEKRRPRYGLIGMQERATALGGEFAAGPTPDGWRVSCRFPLDERVGR
jgi:signal transduction histidine kinase